MLGSFRGAATLGEQIGVDPRRRGATDTVNHRSGCCRDEVREGTDFDAVTTIYRAGVEQPGEVSVGDERRREPEEAFHVGRPSLRGPPSHKAMF